MSKTRYVVRLQPQVIVIEISDCEENCISLSDWVKRVRNGDARVPCTYKFKWHHGENINVDSCELHGRFTYATSRGAPISMDLCVSHYPVLYYTMEEFMKLFRLGKQGWCISSVVNVL